MKLSQIKQMAGDFEATLKDNPLATWGLIIGIVLATLVFGGLAFNAFLDHRRERQKAQALERLQRHLQGLPKSKS